MKQKCEEIIIEQYLKGNITDKEKINYLERINFVRPENKLLEQTYQQLIKNINNADQLFNNVPLPILINKELDTLDFNEFINKYKLHHLSLEDQYNEYAHKILIPKLETED